MATYLVTGGLGFIGSHLCHALAGRGDAVRILDDLSTGRREYAPDTAEVVIGDVADRRTVADAVRGVDGCFHLAAISSVEKSNADWHDCHRVNVGGTVAVLDAARTARSGEPAPVVFASSAAVYGDNPDVPLAETATTVPLSPYGIDKLGSERHAQVAASIHGMAATSLRFFNVYGPRQDPKSPYSGVIAIFAERLLQGQPVDIFGDGEQSRDFIFVGDVVRYLLAAMDGIGDHTGIFNICSGHATTVLDLAATIARICGVELETRLGPPRQGDIRASVGDPARAEAAFAIKAKTPLPQGLKMTLDWIGADLG